MFRSGQTNPFDEVVSNAPAAVIPMSPLLTMCAIAKATDENLTSENWQLILDVCDQVDSKPEDGYPNLIHLHHSHLVLAMLLLPSQSDSLTETPMSNFMRSLYISGLIHTDQSSPRH